MVCFSDMQGQLGSAGKHFPQWPERTRDKAATGGYAAFFSTMPITRARWLRGLPNSSALARARL